MNKLTIELVNSRTNEEIKQLLNICDKLHDGLNVAGYVVGDLPPDSIYEQFRAIAKKDSVVSGTIMYMGSIPKTDDVIEISNAVLMPKFDGCSVALQFTRNGDELILTKAHTRGSDVGENRTNSNIIDKMMQLIPICYFDNSNVSKAVKDRLISISVRAEIVLKNKVLNAEGYNEIVPAATVAGKINGKLKVFTDYIDNIRICAYEISEMIYDNGVDIYSQTDCLRILSHIYYGDKIYLKDYPTKFVDTTSGTYKDFEKIYEEFNANIKQPLDGIVYCSVDWKYPQRIEDTTDTKYLKYAWKPKSESIATIRGIEYSITREGNYSPMILFDAIKLDKSYSRAKSAISNMERFIDSGLGIGSKAILKIAGGINPMIVSVISSSEPKIKLPEKCIWCDRILENVYDKKTNTLVHIKCVNEKCPEILLQKYVYMIGKMNKLCKLKFVNDKGVEIKSSVSEAKLRKLATLNMATVLTLIPNLLDELYKLSLVNQLIVLGFGGEKAVRKLIGMRCWQTLHDVDEKLFCDD